MFAYIGNHYFRLIQDKHYLDPQHLQVNNTGYSTFRPYCVQLFTIKAIPVLSQQQKIAIFEKTKSLSLISKDLVSFINTL